MYPLYRSCNVAVRSIVTVGQQTDRFQIADHNAAVAAAGHCDELKALFGVSG